MTAHTTLVAVSMFAAALAGGSGALAQTDQQQAAQVQPVTAKLSWTCPFSTIELAPVSEDAKGRPAAWVMVYRVDGKVVAAERVSARDVEQIRALPCGPKPDGPPLIG